MRHLQTKTRSNKIAIAAVHFTPTEGYADFVNYEDVREAVLQDILAVQEAGFHSMILENNYDLPHHIYLEPHTVLFLRKIIVDIKPQIKIPFGLSILWNDYKTGFSLARELGASFIRIPVFVDTVETAFGKVDPVAEAAVAYRKLLGCEDIEIFADIHVKHSIILNKDSITESARRAVQLGADALIITGKWTADSPTLDDLANVRRQVGSFPLIVGSGATTTNTKHLLNYANSIIVGTALKPGHVDVKERNMKPFRARINTNLAKEYMGTFNTF